MSDDETEVRFGAEVESPLAKKRQEQADKKVVRSVGPVRGDEGVWVGTCPTCGAKIRLMSETDPNAFWPQGLLPPKGLGVWCDALIDDKSGKRCEGQALVLEANPKTMRVRLHKTTLQAGGGMPEGSRIIQPFARPGIWMPN